MFKNKAEVEQAKTRLETLREELKHQEQLFEKNLHDWIHDLLFVQKIFAGTCWDLVDEYNLRGTLKSVPEDFASLVRSGWHCTYAINDRQYIEFSDNTVYFVVYEDLTEFIQQLGITVTSVDLEEQAEKLREQLAEVEKKLTVVKKG